MQNRIEMCDHIVSIVLLFLSSSVLAQVVPENTPCAEATEVSCGDMITIDPAQLQEDNFSLCDIGYTYGKPSKWYYITGTGQDVYIDLGGSDVSVGVLTGTCTQYTCVSLNGFYDTSTGRYDVRFETTPGARYYLDFNVVDDNNLHDITLSCGTTAKMECDDAVSISCLDSVITLNDRFSDAIVPNYTCRQGTWHGEWAHLIGNGQVFNITWPNDYYTNDILVFSQSCSELVCENVLYQNGVASFLASEGTDYYIVFSSYLKTPPGIKINCTEPPVADQCEDALTLECGTKLTGEWLGYTASSNSCRDYELDLYGTLVGQGKYYRFNDLGGNSGRLWKRGGGCDAGSCNYVPYDHYLYVETGSTVIYELSKRNSSSNYNIELQCQEAVPAQSCAEAISISCTLSQQYDLSFHVPQTLPHYSDSWRVRWFSLSGINEVLDVTISWTDHRYQNTYMALYAGSCDQLDLVDDNRHYVHNMSRTLRVNPSHYSELYIAVFSKEAESEFLLDITCLPAISNNTCESGQIITCGETVFYDFTNASYDKLCDTYFPNDRRNLYYNISLPPASNPYRLGLDGLPNQYYGVIYNASSTCEMACETISTNFLEGGQEYIIELQYRGSGEYTGSFDVSCVEYEDPQNCGDAVLISCGAEITADLTAVLDSSYYYSCDWTRNGRTRWYRFIGDSQKWKFETTSGSYSTFTLYKGDCPDIECIRYDYYSLSVFAEPGESYYLSVLSDDQSVIDFSVTCIEIAENNTCDSPLAISCGGQYSFNFEHYTGEQTNCVNGRRENAFFKMIGNDEFIEFSITGEVKIDGQEGICPGVQCISSIDDDVFYLRKDSNYIFSVERWSGDNITFDLTCHEPLPTSICEEAANLTCGTPIIGTTRFRELTSTYECSYADSARGVWYKIQGDGMIWDISGDISMNLYTSNCGDLQCLANHSGGVDISVLLTEGIPYYLLVYSRYTLGQDYSLDVSCRVPAGNLSPETAILLDCGTSFNMPFSRAIQLSFPCTHYRSRKLFYRVSGNNSFVQIANLSSYAVFEADNLSNCVRSTQGYYFLEEGIDYIFVCESYYNNQDRQGTLVCRPEMPTNSFEEPESLPCSSFIIDSLYFAAPTIFRDSCIRDIETRGRWYKFEMSDNEIMDIGLQSRYANWVIYVKDCGVLRCITSDNTVRLTQQSDNEYLAYVYNDINQLQSDYLITTSCRASIANNSCAFPELLDCGAVVSSIPHELASPSSPSCRLNANTLYYTIKGEGNIVGFSTINIDLFKGGCDQRECIDPLDRYSGNSYYKLEFKTDYLVVYYPEVTDNRLEVSCVEEIEGGDCSEATELIVDTTYNGSTFLQKPVEYRSEWCIEAPLRIDWYYIEGNDQLYTLSSNDFGDISYQLLEGNCDRLACTELTNSGNTFIQFYLEKGQRKYLAIYSAGTESGRDYLLTLSSMTPEPHVLCETAAFISCGDTLNVNFENAISQSEFACIYELSRKIYYKVIGAGNYIYFASDNHPYLLEPFIIEANCDDLQAAQCTEGVRIVSGISSARYISDAFYLENEVEYLVVFQSQNSSNYHSPVQVLCGDRLDVNPCDNLLQVSSDTTIRTSSLFTGYDDQCAYINPYGEFIDIDVKDKVLKLDYSYNGSFPNTQIYLVEEGCESAGTCDAYRKISGQSPIYLSQVDDHLIYVNHSTYGFAELEMFFDFQENPPGNKCSEPINVFGDTSFTWSAGDFTFNPIDGSNGNSSNSGGNIFLSLPGNDSLLSSISFTSNNTRYKLYRGSCSDNNILSTKLPILLEKNSRYVVEIYFSHSRFTTEEEVRIELSPTTRPFDHLAAEVVTCDDFIQGSFSDNPHYSLFSCYENLSSKIDWYKITGTDQMYSFEFGGSSTFFHVHSIADQDLICMDINSAYWLEDGLEYYISVGGYFDLSYEFSIHCGDMVSNDTITSPINISCGDQISADFTGVLASSVACSNRLYPTLYYRLVGNGTVSSFTVDGYERLGLLRNGECLRYERESFSHFLIENEEYILFVEDRNRHDYFSLSVTCEEVDIVVCDRLAELICGTSISDTMRLHYFAEDISDCDGTTLRPGLWYSIKGEGQHMYFDLHSYIYASTFTLYEGLCISNLCPVQASNSGYFLEDGKYYFLEVRPYYYGPGDYKFHLDLQCYDESLNDNCENAIVISCGYQEELNFRISDYSFTPCSNNYGRALWFEIEGTNEYYRFEGRHTDVEVIVGNCSEYECVSSNEYGEYYLQSGVNYKLRVGGYNSSEFSVTCIPSLRFEEDDCNAQQQCEFAGLPCDDHNSITTDDRYDESCNCLGNPNGLADCTEDILHIDSIHQPQFEYWSDSLIYLETSAPPSGQLIFNASSGFSIERALEIPIATSISVNITVCPRGQTDR